MKLTEEQIVQLKAVELEILKEFIEICEKLKLRYYLMDGTMLGAVRHQGFIPWDDDIDVGMPREDYEIFIKKGADMLSDHLFLQNSDSDPEYLMCFSKIRNSNSTFIESSVHHLKINHGVFIDVFPLDYYPEERKQQRRLDWKKRLYDLRIASEFDLQNINKIKRVVASLVLKTVFPSVKAVINKREKLIREVPKSGLLANYGSAWGKKEIVPIEWFGEGDTAVFEGMEVKIPAQYDKWLTQVYGDYMQLPPVEKRVGHHYVDAIDFNKPYTEYTEEIL